MRYCTSIFAVQVSELIFSEGMSLKSLLLQKNK